MGDLIETYNIIYEKEALKWERFFALVVHKAIQGFMHKLFKGTTRSIRKEIPQCNSFRLME